MTYGMIEQSGVTLSVTKATFSYVKEVLKTAEKERYL